MSTFKKESARAEIEITELMQKVSTQRRGIDTTIVAASLLET
jgi:hypothetical protein